MFLGCSVAYLFTFLGSWAPSILQLTFKKCILFFRGLLKSLVLVDILLQRLSCGWARDIQLLGFHFAWGC